MVAETAPVAAATLPASEIFPTSFLYSGGHASACAAAAPLTAPTVGIDSIVLLRARLRAVLLAWTAFDRPQPSTGGSEGQPEEGVGYVQGMNFIAAMLLRHVNTGDAWLVSGADMRKLRCCECIVVDVRPSQPPDAT